MERNQLELKNKHLFFEQMDYYEEKFNIKKILLYRNKKKITLNLKKMKIKKSFSLWYNLPYSLLIYAFNLRGFHQMQNYFYALQDSVLIKKHRRIYIKNYKIKNLTSFDCYHIFCKDILALYSWLEEMAEYNIIILGLEIHNKLYPLEDISKYLKSIKSDLELFYDFYYSFIKNFNKAFSTFNNIDIEYQSYLNQILLICQHTIK